MASGDTIGAILKAFPPSSNAAIPGLTAAQYPLWRYDDTTTKTMYFECLMFGQYDGSSDIDVILPWKFTTFVGSQTSDWEVSFYRIADDADSIETFSFAAAQTVLDTEASATGEVSYASVTFTNAQADGIQPGEKFVLRVVRDATGGTASPGDAELTTPAIQQA